MDRQPFLNTDAIASASELINSSLLAKGYIDEKLLFNSINHKELTTQKDDENGQKIEVNDIIYNNDKNIINIIYSLLQSIDRNKDQSKQFNKIVSSKDASIAALNKRIRNLENQLERANSKLERNIEVENIQLSRKLKEVTQINKLQTKDLTKLKHWCFEVKTKYQVESRKKAQEIERLKDLLLDKRNLSTTLSYGIPLKSESTIKNEPDSTMENINSNIIYNNIPAIDNSALMVSRSEEATEALEEQYKQIIMDLSSLVENLIVENHKYSSFSKQINSYFSELGDSLSKVNARNIEVRELAGPSKSIDFDTINSINTSDLHEKSEELLDQIESFEISCKPLLNNIYKNHHKISYLVELLGLNDSKGVPKNGDADKIEELKSELEMVRKNWRDSIKTLENWKEYELGQSKEI